MDRPSDIPPTPTPGAVLASDGGGCDLILASASPRRAELLSRVGLRLQVRPADVDERPLPDEPPEQYARRVTADKLAAVRAGLPDDAVQGPAALPILSADTVVVLDRQILGKPEHAEQAADMLRALAGRRHAVLTAYRIQRGDAVVERAVTTAVTFRLLAPEEIAAYVRSGEWQGKAGGYAIQGIAALFATEIRGSITNVVGLPLAEVVADLRAVGGLAGWPPPAFGQEPA